MDKLEVVKDILEVCETGKLEKVEARLEELKREIGELEPGLDYVRKMEVADYVLAVHYVLTHYKIERKEQDD